MFYPLSFWASGHLMKRPADYHLSTRHLIEADLTASTCWFWRPKARGTHEITGAPVCFSRSAPPSGSLEEARTARRKEASKLSLGFSCQWLRRGGLLRFAPSLLSNAETDDPEEVDLGRGGGKSLLVGVFAPVWTWGRGGFTWRPREEAALVERRRSAAAQLSRAERRGAVRERRLTIRQLEERTLTNPYGCLRNTDQSPLPPLFSFFLGDFWLFNIVQSRSLWQV